ISGNIPTLGMFSWALATLTKNASIVRISEENREPASRLFGSLAQVRAEYKGKTYRGADILAKTLVMHFPAADTALNHDMSMAADARAIWGGMEAVRAITAYPRLEHCEDVIFGPKFSVGVIDQATVQQASALRQAVCAFVRSAVMFEQAAC